MPIDIVSQVQNPPRIDDASAGGRLFKSGAQLVEYQQWLASYIRVGGFTIDISTPLALDLAADEPVDNTGTGTGGAFAANTVYFLYVSNGGAIVPTKLVGSTTAPSFGNGTLSLGATGTTAAAYRYVGVLRTNAATGIDDSLINRDLINHYNRSRARLFVCPGYADDNATTTYNYAVAAWGLMHAAASVKWLSDVDNPCQLALVYDLGAMGAGIGWLGIGIDSTAQPIVAVRFPNGAAERGGQLQLESLNVTRGAQSTANGIAFSSGAVNMTLIADHVRSGAAVDPFATYIEGSVWA